MAAIYLFLGMLCFFNAWGSSSFSMDIDHGDSGAALPTSSSSITLNSTMPSTISDDEIKRDTTSGQSSNQQRPHRKDFLVACPQELVTEKYNALKKKDINVLQDIIKSIKKVAPETSAMILTAQQDTTKKAMQFWLNYYDLMYKLRYQVVKLPTEDLSSELITSMEHMVASCNKNKKEWPEITYSFGKIAQSYRNFPLAQKFFSQIIQKGKSVSLAKDAWKSLSDIAQETDNSRIRCTSNEQIFFMKYSPFDFSIAKKVYEYYSSKPMEGIAFFLRITNHNNLQENALFVGNFYLGCLMIEHAQTFVRNIGANNPNSSQNIMATGANHITEAQKKIILPPDMAKHGLINQIYAYLMMGDATKANAHQEMLFSIMETDEQVAFLLKIGSDYLDLGLTDHAEKAFETARDIAIHAPIPSIAVDQRPHMIVMLAKKLAPIKENKGDLQKAIDYYKILQESASLPITERMQFSQKVNQLSAKLAALTNTSMAYDGLMDNRSSAIENGNPFNPVMPMDIDPTDDGEDFSRRVVADNDDHPQPSLSGGSDMPAHHSIDTQALPYDTFMIIQDPPLIIHQDMTAPATLTGDQTVQTATLSDAAEPSTYKERKRKKK